MLELGPQVWVPGDTASLPLSLLLPAPLTSSPSFSPSSSPSSLPPPPPSSSLTPLLLSPCHAVFSGLLLASQSVEQTVCRRKSKVCILQKSIQLQVY